MADTAEGGGGAAPVVNIDVSGIEKALTRDEKYLLQDIAIRLFANSEFDKSGKSAQQLANDAVERARILLSKLPK